MGDDTLGRVIALLVVGLFLFAQVVSYVNVKRPVPAELYPLTTMAVGYLLGHRFFRDENNHKERKRK